MVLCETYQSDDKTPALANFRHTAKKIFEASKEHFPWFGFEQEYILLKHDGTYQTSPLGFPRGGYAQPQGKYYCGAGASKAIGRAVAEAHLKASLAAGIQISGLNAEVFPGQWEFQVGPVEGIAAADQLWMSRYMLIR